MKILNGTGLGLIQGKVIPKVWLYQEMMWPHKVFESVYTAKKVLGLFFLMIIIALITIPVYKSEKFQCVSVVPYDSYETLKCIL